MSSRRLTLVSALSALDNALAGGDGNFSPPLGVLTLASILRDSFEVSLVDLDHLWWHSDSGRERFQERAHRAIIASRPDFLGFSTISGSYPATIRLAEASSRDLPNVPIIFGGPQASVVDTATLKAFPFLPYIVRGEADESLPCYWTLSYAAIILHFSPGSRPDPETASCVTRMRRQFWI